MPKVVSKIFYFLEYENTTSQPNTREAIMQTLCFACGRLIKDGLAETYSSSGLCARCLTKAMKGLQKRQGNFDCFGTAIHGHCDQRECKYREVCLSISQGQAV